MRRTFSYLVAMTLVVPVATEAALTVSLQPSNQTFASGTAASGFFDVFVTGTGGDSVGSYSIELSATPPSSGVGFNTSAPLTNATSAPNGYIFDTRGSIFTFASSASNIQYLDSPLSGANSTTVGSGETYGAGRVFFEIASNAAPGVYAFDFNLVTSQFLTPAQGMITTAFVPGSITILPANVPEPSTTILLGLTGVVGFGVSRFRKRRASAATAA